MRGFSILKHNLYKREQEYQYHQYHYVYQLILFICIVFFLSITLNIIIAFLFFIFEFLIEINEIYDYYILKENRYKLKKIRNIKTNIEFS